MAKERSKNKLLERQIQVVANDALAKGWRIKRGFERDSLHRECGVLAGHIADFSIAQLAEIFQVSPAWIRSFQHGFDYGKVYHTEPSASRLGHKLRQVYVTLR